jgi:competence protein ComEC
MITLSIFWIVFVCLGLFSLSFYFGRRNQIDYSQRWWFGAILFVFIYFLGFWSVFRYDESFSPNNFATHLNEKGDDNLIVQIDELPTKSKRVKVIGKVLQCNNQNSNGHILLYLDSDEYSLKLNYGDVIAVHGSPYLIPAPQNPYAFDFQNHMKLRNVRYSALIGNEQAQTLAQRRGNPIMHLAYDAQETLLAVLAQYLEDENDVFSVGSALILGGRSDISEETLDAYINTGAMHVLSVSGLHVGLVATLFARVIKKVKGSQKFWKILEPLLQLIFIWCFALITGAASCILRAAVMFSFVIVGRSVSRDSNIYNLLAVSAFILLVYNPYFLFDVSFQLSYIGLLGIIYFQPYVYSFGTNNVALFRESYVFNHLWELTSVSIGAMLTTTPISIYYFHQFPTYFWLSGLIVVPAATAALYVGLFLFVIHWWVDLALWVGKLLSCIICLMNKSLLYIEQFPPGVIRDIWVDIFSSISWYLIVFFIGIALFKKQLKWLNYALLGLIIVLFQYNYLEIQSNNQNMMVFYQSGKELLIDIFEGEQVYAIQSKNMSERNVEFASYNNRLKHRSGHSEVKTFLIADSLQYNNLKLENNLCQYKEKKVFLLENPIQINDLAESIKVDYLVIHNSPFLDFDLLTQKIEAQKVIFTSANKVGALKFYKSQCEQRQIGYHDIKENGAFIVDLKQN